MYRYHDGTKHSFRHFARSLGYLDWASQPRPFRGFADARVFPLYPAPEADARGYDIPRATFDETRQLTTPAQPLTAAAIGDVLRHALGLSAWKRFDKSRWALRVNPSSGNLHPTEAYVICGALPGLADQPAVYHYAADRHALELRCTFDPGAWTHDGFLLALTSIHWREAWKYGERAFRYCQHDLGHASSAVSIAAGLVGWRTAIQPAWSHHDIAAVAGLDRDEDFFEAEREEPGCLIAAPAGVAVSVGPLVDAVRAGQWSGRASQLSEEHVTWSFIDEVAQATVNPGRRGAGLSGPPTPPATATAANARPAPLDRHIDARMLLLQRRSAVAFDGKSTIDRAAFLRMLSAVMPGETAPWNSTWWSARVHLAIFVHRVDDMAPGLYVLLRDAGALDRLRAACRPDFLWEAADADVPLWHLAPATVGRLAARLSCDQDIASDGFFSLGMIADFDASLETFGPSFYRHLFWETGMVGQVLYLEAEAAGARATGIGCFFDDPVHDVLGIRDHAFQSLYHFTVGIPVDDDRLTTEPGYAWETT